MKTIHNAGKLALAAVMLVSANAYAMKTDGDLKSDAARAACVSACPKGSAYHSPFLVSGRQQDRFADFVGELTQTAMLVGAGYVTGKAAEKCFAQGLNGWNQSTGVGAYLSPLLAWTVGVGAVAAGFAVAGMNILNREAASRAAADNNTLRGFGLVALAAIATFINEWSKESAVVQADLLAMENALNTPATSSTDASSTDASKRNAAAKMSMPAKK